MRSQEQFGSMPTLYEPDYSAPAGNGTRGTWPLRDLAIRTRFLLGLGLLSMLVVGTVFAGIQGLKGVNRHLVGTIDDNHSRVLTLAETRSRLNAVGSGLQQITVAQGGQIPGRVKTDMVEASRLLDHLIVEGRKLDERLTQEGQRLYAAAVAWLMGLSGVGITLGLALAFFYGRVVASPPGAPGGALERVAARDLTVSLQARSRDEAGQAVQNTGRMDERLTMAEAQKMLHERLRTLGEVAESVTHKFNNVLAVALGQAELLLLDASSPREGLQAIRRAALQGRETVRRLQYFTKNGGFREQPVWVVPSQIVEEVIASAAPEWKVRAQERGVTYEIRRDFRPGPAVLVPGSALKEVLLNLVHNALEAMPGGGPIGIRVWTEDTHVLFAVSDKGEGIEKANRQRIFDPFFTTRPAPASGLGLSICARIMFSLGGTVVVASEVGRGSTFTVRLPLPQGVQAVATRHASSTRLLPRRSRILLIDDEPQGAETLARFLRQAGHSVETAVTGNAGIERYRQGRFDCVVTGLVMPGLAGLTVARAIKDHDPTAYVVLVTAHAEQVNASQSAAAGVDRVMLKPVSREQLLTMFEADEPTGREFALETSCPRA